MAAPNARLSILSGLTLALLAAKNARGDDQVFEIQLLQRGAEEQSWYSSVDLRNIPPAVVDKHDQQLGEVRRFRGVPLEWLIGLFPGGATFDTAILAFHNGMRVPVSLAPESLAGLDAFVATDIGGPDGWEGQLPEVGGPSQRAGAQRPLVFLGNKLVVSPATQGVPGGAWAGAFNPWPYVDTLVAIELVNRAQEEAKVPTSSTAEVKRGRAQFLARCQCCHGVGGAGATHGWDVLRPVPLYQWRGPSSLFAHLNRLRADAVERGDAMPPQPDLEASDVEDIFRWMSDVARPRGSKD